MLDLPKPQFEMSVQILIIVSTTKKNDMIKIELKLGCIWKNHIKWRASDTKL